MSKIYGIDTSKDYTLIDVRDAIVECFTLAHKKILEQDLGEFASVMEKQNFERLKAMNILKMVRAVFQKLGANFNNPARQDLIRVCDELSEIARRYRGEKIIKKHYLEIMKLLEKFD
ncbi:MAG: hypothetical protein ABIF17_05400 [Patescibacteria group bacterium]